LKLEANVRMNARTVAQLVMNAAEPAASATLRLLGYLEKLQSIAK